MATNVARLRALLSEGWDVVEIGSDVGDIDVVLRRGRQRICVRLDRSDAAEILYGRATAPLA